VLKRFRDGNEKLLEARFAKARWMFRSSFRPTLVAEFPACGFPDLGWLTGQ